MATVVDVLISERTLKSPSQNGAGACGKSDELSGLCPITSIEWCAKLSSRAGEPPDACWLVDTVAGTVKMRMEDEQMSFLAAIPIYNEEKHVAFVISEITCCVRDIVVVDDGSTDRSPEILSELAREYPGLRVIRHESNQGYGKSLIDAFDFAVANEFEHVITLDCDEQHQPSEILDFVLGIDSLDIVSGSRFHPESKYEGIPPPEQRRRVGQLVLDRINGITGWNLTDAFCGFKAYRTAALKKLRLTEHGYGMPLQLWIQAWKAGLRVGEKPVTLKYLSPTRSFGGALDDPDVRLKYYYELIDRELAGG